MSDDGFCLDCFIQAGEAAEEAMLGWEGVQDFYAEFYASCPDANPTSPARKEQT